MADPNPSSNKNDLLDNGRYNKNNMQVILIAYGLKNIRKEEYPAMSSGSKLIVLPRGLWVKTKSCYEQHKYAYYIVWEKTK